MNIKQFFYLCILINYYFFIPPLIRDIKNKIIKITKTILAIPAAAPAIPPNPKMAAIIAIITNVIVQRNIIIYFLMVYKLNSLVTYFLLQI